MCNSMHKDFKDKAISASETSCGIFVGRPRGGLAILWRKILGANGKIQTYNDKCCMGTECFYR